jgi:hypothetical protein
MDRFLIWNLNSQKVLDVPGSSSANSVRIIQYTKHGGLNQQWKLEAAGTSFLIVSVATGKVLDVQGGSRSAGAAIIQYSRHGGANQRWTLERDNTPGGASVAVHRIRSQLSGLMLDVPWGSTQNGAQLQQWWFSPTTNQIWFLEKV